LKKITVNGREVTYRQKLQKCRAYFCIFCKIKKNTGKGREPTHRDTLQGDRTATPVQNKKLHPPPHTHTQASTFSKVSVAAGHAQMMTQT